MFYENLIAECERQGIKLTPFIKGLGISPGSIGRWKNGGTVTSDLLIKISDRLGVTADYLLRGTSQSNEDTIYCVNEDEEAILTMYRDLPSINKTFIHDTIKAAHDRVQKERENSGNLPR